MNISKKYLVLLTSLMLLSFASNAWSATFWKTGKINRLLTETNLFGGCMVNISTKISNGCPANGWVSLDCDAKHSDPGDGHRAYASALVAFAMNKKISVKVDNSKKVNGYCVATRLDIRS